MKRAKNICKVLLDIVEIWVPAILLLTLFIAFVLGVFFRYVMKNPQSWTYELSSIAFLSFAIVSACYVQRVEKHIVFDMLFNKMSVKTQCAMRIFSNVVITVTCVLLTPATIKFIGSMKNLTSQILKIPRGLIFACFLLLFFSTAIRAGVRVFLDSVAFKNKSYTQKYAIEEEVDE